MQTLVQFERSSTRSTGVAIHSTYLRQMLVQRVGEVVGAIDVSPSEGLGKGRFEFADVLVRQSTQHMLGPIVSVENFDLVHPLLRRGNPHGQGSYGGKEDLHLV